MPNTTWRHHTTAAILTLLLATSCTTPAAPTPTPSPTDTQAPYTLPAPTSTTTAPPTPQPTETFNPDQQAAAETVLEWFRLWEVVRASLDAPTDDFAYSMTGSAQAVLMAALNDEREEGHIATGTLHVHIAGAAAAEANEEGISISVSACTDSSEYELVQADTGTPVELQTRVYYVNWTIDVVYKEAAGRWYISEFNSEATKSCTG